jgi:hypothetical protein
LEISFFSIVNSTNFATLLENIAKTFQHKIEGGGGEKNQQT